MNEFKKVQDLTQVDPSVFEKLDILNHLPELDHWKYIAIVELIHEDVLKETEDTAIIYQNKNTDEMVCIPVQQTWDGDKYEKAYPVQQRLVSGYHIYERI